MMKNFTFVVLMMLFGSFWGCGPSATDTSGTAPPLSEEEIAQELEKAVESGKIDPATYGK